VRLTIEIDDDELRRLLAPFLQQTPSIQTTVAPTRLLSVRDVADHLGISRSKVYELVYKGEISSVAIGRRKRISQAALAEFVSRPADIASPIPPGILYKPEHRPQHAPTSPMQPDKPRQGGERKLKSEMPIDLSAKPLPPNSPDRQMTDKEWEDLCASLLGHGWPQDLVDQMRTDRNEGVDRIHVLTLDGAARYLGLSRHAVDLLIKAGKLRLFTIAPLYRNEKPAQRIPAKDVLALAQGSSQTSTRQAHVLTQILCEEDERRAENLGHGEAWGLDAASSSCISC
jgi:excisionase family DNA binding protein